MGHGDQRAAAGVVQQRLHHGRTGFEVQVAGGLVRQDDGGLLDQRPGDGHALFLAAGEPADPAPLEAQDAQAVQQSVHVRGVHALQPQDIEVVLDGQLLQQLEILEDVADAVDAKAVALARGKGGDVPPIHQHAALRGGQQARQQVQKGGLAAAGRAQQRVGPAVIKGHVAVADAGAIRKPN